MYFRGVVKSSEEEFEKEDRELREKALTHIGSLGS